MSPVQLQPRDRLLLEHVARYRLTTVEVVHKLFFAGKDVETAKSVLKRMNAGYLRSQPLFGRRRYYQLSSVSASMLGEPDEATRPFGPSALPTRFGVVSFCCLGPGPERVRLRQLEFEEAFPELADLRFNDTYLERAGTTPKLGRILLDLGGDHLRFLRKVHEYARRDMAHRHFRQMVEAGAFVLTLITAEETKRAAIVEALSRRPLPMTCRVETVPELINFLRSDGP